MRSGNYIQALGRQSFQPSQPASAPSPGDERLPSERANERQRELIKAQNDVLATVGVCLHENKSHHEEAESQKAEDKAGLCIDALDLTVTYLVIWPLIGIRNRLQTYRVYEGMRYRDVLRLAWTRSTWEDMFSGMPAHLLFQVSNLGRDWLRTILRAWLEERSFFRHPVTDRPRHCGVLHVIDKLIDFAAWSLVYPIWYHSNLQVLHLAGSRPLFPSLASFVAFSAASPISAPVLVGPLFSLATGKSLLYQAATSYFVQSFVTHLVSLELQTYFYRHLIAILPNPNSGKKPTALQGNSYSERMDLEPEANFAPTVGPSALTIEDTTNSSHTATIPLDPVTGTIIPSAPEVMIDPLELDETDSEASRPPSPSLHPGPLRRASSLARRRQQEAADEALAAAARHRQDSQTAGGGGGGANTNRTQYRTTLLSGHPVAVAALHVTECITTVIMLATESATLRTLARGVLAARGLHGPVYPPLQLFGPGQALVVRALVAGEWAAMWCLFEASWAASTVVGIRWFGYARFW